MTEFHNEILTLFISNFILSSLSIFFKSCRRTKPNTHRLAAQTDKMLRQSQQFPNQHFCHHTSTVKDDISTASCIKTHPSRQTHLSTEQSIIHCIRPAQKGLFLFTVSLMVSWWLTMTGSSFLTCSYIFTVFFSPDTHPTPPPCHGSTAFPWKTYSLVLGLGASAAGCVDGSSSTPLDCHPSWPTMIGYSLWLSCRFVLPVFLRLVAGSLISLWSLEW